MSPTESSGVLEPSLSALDKRVLRAIPDDESPAIDVWDLGRALDEMDLPTLLQILRGMEHFGLVYRHWTGSRKPDLFTRTHKGT